MDFRLKQQGEAPASKGQIYVNGKGMGYWCGVGWGKPTSYHFLVDYTTDYLKGLNPFWLGGSRWTRSPAHSTIDEFYLTTDYEIKEFRKRLCPTCKGTGRERHDQEVGLEPCYGTRMQLCKEGSLGCKGVGGWWFEKPGEITLCNLCAWDWWQYQSFGKCPYCSNGRVSVPCWGCDGKGTIRNPITGEIVACPICNRQKILKLRCVLCRGTGICPRCGGDIIKMAVFTPCPWCRGGYWDCFSNRKAKLRDCKGYITCRSCRGRGIKADNDIGNIIIPQLTYVAEAIGIWCRGRYYRQNDAWFTSQEIDLGRIVDKTLAQPNPVPDPYGRSRWRGDEGLSQEQCREWLEQTWYYPRVKILGLSWTGYTDDIQDYQDCHGIGAWLLSPQLEVSLEVKDSHGKWVQVAGPFLNHDAGWAPVLVKLPRRYPQVRYRVRFNTRCDPVNAILLETPILDDLTIYYTTRPQFFTWQEGY
jgi:hypothetical protein